MRWKNGESEYIKNFHWKNFTEMNLNISGTTTLNSGTINGTLSLGSRIENYLINLWGTNNYGFGITAGTLMYSSQSFHKFYN